MNKIQIYILYILNILYHKIKINAYFKYNLSTNTFHNNLSYINLSQITYCYLISVINWNKISTALQQVIKEVSALSVQVTSMNSRISKIEATIANNAFLFSGPLTLSAPSYISSSMSGWDDHHLLLITIITINWLMWTLSQLYLLLVSLWFRISLHSLLSQCFPILLKTWNKSSPL